MEKKTKQRRKLFFFEQRLIIRIKETGRGLTTRWTNESGKRNTWWRGGKVGEIVLTASWLNIRCENGDNTSDSNSSVKCVLSHVYNQPLKMLAYKPLYYFHSQPGRLAHCSVFAALNLNSIMWIVTMKTDSNSNRVSNTRVSTWLIGWISKSDSTNEIGELEWPFGMAIKT